MKLKDLRIKSKLRLPILIQLILVCVFIYFYFSVESLAQKERTGNEVLRLAASKIDRMSFSIGDFMKGKNVYEEINTQHGGLVKMFKDTPAVFSDEKKVEDFVGLGDRLKDIEKLFKENTDIEKKIFELTDLSISQSGEYLKKISEKLVVSTIERRIIASAALNNDTNFTIKVLFLKAKESVENSDRLMKLLDESIKNAEMAEKSLASTPFAALLKKAKELNTEIKTIAAKFSENLKTIDKLKQDIDNDFNITLDYIKNMDNERVGVALSSFKRIFYALFVWASIIAVLVILVSLLISRWITRPLNALIERARDLALENVDMSKRLEIDSKDDIGELSGWFNKFLDRLEQLITKVRKSSDEVSGATEKIASGSEDLAVRVSEQAASITETSTTIEQFASTVRQNTESSVEADMMLIEFNSGIREKNTLIENVTSTMDEIYDSSKQIDNIIKVINDISFQTNLLALNAAVEAARAGEAGRGFAVVASEVRNLAQKTAASSKSIQEIVVRNVESTQKGKELVKDTSEFFNEIVGVMDDIVQKIANITNVSRGQAAGIEQINHAIAQMENVSSQNARLVDDLSASGKNLKTNAIELQKLVSEFKVSEISVSSKQKKTDGKKGIGKFEKVEKIEKKTGLKKKDKKEDEEKVEIKLEAKKEPAPNKNESEKDVKGVKKTAPAADDFFGTTDEDGFEEF
jgi:methyl-accepting chemotaxis protein